MLSSWEHVESRKKNLVHHNLLKYWFTLFHFALGDPGFDKQTEFAKGAFTNCVNMFLAFFDPISPLPMQCMAFLLT